MKAILVIAAFLMASFSVSAHACNQPGMSLFDTTTASTAIKSAGSGVSTDDASTQE